MPCYLLPKIQNVLQAIDNCYRKHSIAAKQMTNSDQFDTRFNLLLTAFERIDQQIEQLGHRTDSNARAIESTNQQIERISQQIEQLGHRTDSNARAIEALTDTVHELKRDRAQAYSLMANLAQSQANL
ncbi:MAG: hypothetical protein F6K26_51275, partial [Moorea sp. SIO2I5]|nr:hypothetical protein [Moorena sp. SIO2I5]